MMYRLSVRKTEPGARWTMLDKPYDLTLIQIQTLQTYAADRGGKMVAMLDWSEEGNAHEC
jgi:hypothetical protein